MIVEIVPQYIHYHGGLQDPVGEICDTQLYPTPLDKSQKDYHSENVPSEKEKQVIIWLEK